MCDLRPGFGAILLKADALPGSQARARGSSLRVDARALPLARVAWIEKAFGPYDPQRDSGRALRSGCASFVGLGLGFRV